MLILNQSVKKIFTFKKRPNFNPLIIHYKNIKSLKKDAILNSSFTKLYKNFCPGPITFILKKNPKSKISYKATAKKNTIAVRFPKHIVARKLLDSNKRSSCCSKRKYRFKTEPDFFAMM